MLDWTGERFIPGEGGARLRYEHQHRYELARLHAAGRRVLDYGSGEGYGSLLLSDVASSVVGVDIDPQAVSHASERYRSQSNLTFTSLDGHTLPFDDQHFDLITCFEVIEHVPNPDEVLAELSRLLAIDGMLLISTPNKAEYSDKHDYRNEYHIREFYIDEFREFLEARFSDVQFLGQRLITTSLLADMDGPVESFIVTREAAGAHLPTLPFVPIYVIAACRHRSGHRIGSSVLMTEDDSLSEEALHAVPRPVVDKVLADMDVERTAARRQLDRDAEQLAANQQLLAELQRQLADRAQPNDDTVMRTPQRLLRWLRRWLRRSQ